MPKKKLNGTVLIMKLPARLKLQLQFAAHDQRVTVSQLVRSFIEQGLKRKGKA